MASIFNSLNIGYSGLNASQVGINVTGNNISNAETEGYSRQRVAMQAAQPISLNPGQRGNGTEIAEIARVFDNFVYDRYTNFSEKKENSDFMKKTLEELSSYFPEIDNIGIKADLEEYFNMWQSVSDNPDNSAVKIALASQTKTLTDHLQQTRTQIGDLQKSLNKELVSVVDEVNRKAQEIADINAAIDSVESNDKQNANDLKDKRNLLERSIARLIGANSYEGLIESNNIIDSNSNKKTGSYSLLVDGYNIVDGPNVHKLTIDPDEHINGMFNIYYERQDGKKFNLTPDIKGGKAGAILQMRGSKFDPATNIPSNGFLQDTMSLLDSFAAGIIESTNNIYAEAATTQMNSNILELDASEKLTQSNLNINEGSFDVNVFDVDGNKVATRTIAIDANTAMDDGTSSSIVGQITKKADDNSDNNATNDIDDILQASYSGQVFKLNLNSDYQNRGYTFNISDNYAQSLQNGTNFAGAVGASRFFDGTGADDIEMSSDLQNNPLEIKAHAEDVSGNNSVALNMVQLQFEQVKFTNKQTTSQNTLYGYFDSVVSNVGSRTNAEITKNDSITAQFKASELEYQSVSKVNMDEELTNLIKYQTSYGAAAKVITTIDQMMNTLLGLKQ